MDHEENEKRLEELKSIIREQESRLHHLQSIAFQLANYYFVFQGVILTAICDGSTSLSCSDRWFLFTVSLLAATLNLLLRFLVAGISSAGNMNGRSNKEMINESKFVKVHASKCIRICTEF
ncbi:hypothetical protein Pint_12732 [Pistacia integerrima]|uniref:Uncharacterized protein n=1 Tax=Pistacia integerrima TaxID=434235 RepID=A0ACC0Y843_9ROSI|nr:hypothetical protein Pint_12732 [Pistacia integerrima]